MNGIVCHICEHMCGNHEKIRLAAWVINFAAASYFLLVASTSTQTLTTSNGQVVDKIAAVVNNEVITQYELDQRVNLVMRSLVQRNAPPLLSMIDYLHAQVLNQMVLEYIQL